MFAVRVLFEDLSRVETHRTGSISEPLRQKPAVIPGAIEKSAQNRGL